MKTKLIIGTRGSALALKQSEIVEQKLRKLALQIQIETKIIKTEGDKNQNPIPQSSIGKSWFTKEIEKELTDETIDLAVHSLKDLPTALPEGLKITAYLNREDAADVLVAKANKKLSELKPNAIIGTDSIRRKAQILAIRPDLEVKSIRGNVPTRLSKLFEEQEYDGIILAKAGLVRLGLEDRISEEFSPEDFVPSPGQGILAVETKEGTEIAGLVSQINDSNTQILALAERSFSAEIGGGCKMPVGVHAQLKKDNTIKITGLVALPDGSEIVKESAVGEMSNAEELARNLAKQIIAKCSRECRDMLNEK